ncbi:hypothetical protein AYI69_g9813 [Smittium culicis]|uniref:Uncharacterized protein n=1 Tax=Smittium culicis TaxID=133412 RepID=A0A1R1XA06_9FUNG|nr:hypothetical protein AYI69_g9813 [Smittium culicis]
MADRLVEAEQQAVGGAPDLRLLGRTTPEAAQGDAGEVPRDPEHVRERASDSGGSSGACGCAAGACVCGGTRASGVADERADGCSDIDEFPESAGQVPMDIQLRRSIPGARAESVQTAAEVGTRKPRVHGSSRLRARSGSDSTWRRVPRTVGLLRVRVPPMRSALHPRTLRVRRRARNVLVLWAGQHFADEYWVPQRTPRLPADSVEQNEAAFWDSEGILRASVLPHFVGVPPVRLCLQTVQQPS